MNRKNKLTQHVLSQTNRTAIK